MAKDLAKLFGVEHLIEKRTLIKEKKSEVYNKTPNESSEDIRAILDEINIRVVSGDIVGVEECLAAIQLRLDMLKSVAAEIRKRMGK